jgi:hypothetical protein
MLRGDLVIPIVVPVIFEHLRPDARHGDIAEFDVTSRQMLEIDVRELAERIYEAIGAMLFEGE